MSDKILTVQQPSQEMVTTWVRNRYISASTSDNTRRAYRSDIRHYEAWGGKLPAHPEMISRYLEVHAEHLNPRTLLRRVTAIKNWHLYQQFPDPTSHPIIHKLLSGIMRLHGKPKQKALPVSMQHLQQLTDYLSAQTQADAIRDLALLQVGFFGALRRSELVNIQAEHLQWDERGIEILLPASKTDQLRVGQHCAIPNGRGKLCAVTQLKRWLDHAAISEGPIFRRIHPSGQLADNALHPHTVNIILKQRAQEAGILDAAQFSSHSLRRGLATCAARAGASMQSIMRQGRWKQVATVLEYIEAAERFSENAAESVLAKFSAEETS